MKPAEINALYTEIVNREGWGAEYRPGRPGYSLPFFKLPYEYALDSDIDRQMLQHKGVVVTGAGFGGRLYLDEEQVGLNVHITGSGAHSRIILGLCQTLNGVFSCLGDEAMMVFAGSPSESIGLAADLINYRASMFVGANGVCYGLRGTVEGDHCIIIGDDCLISDQIELRASDSHSIISVRSGKVINLPGSIIVEPHVWLSQGVVILKNVTVGGGSIIATRSVVTKSVPGLSLCAGTPAKVIKDAVSWHRSYPSSIADSYWQIGPDGFVPADGPPNASSSDGAWPAQHQARAVIEATYTSILQRPPDGHGLEHFSNRIKVLGFQIGTSEMITQLLGSEERRLLLGRLDKL